MEIEAAELFAQLGSGAPVHLIDCREEDEFQICRIAGAKLFPLSNFGSHDLIQFLAPKEQSPDTPIVVYCHHGMRSLRAVGYLRSLGFENARSLSGGIDLWSAVIDPSLPRY